ncbi:MAG: peptidyl-prolyl cis-trans isomerase [Thermoleophilaceae bacterium]|nr:peptidyl-prolyl cis-trans isomerase [Thermoleophilaceae bacterium]
MKNITSNKYFIPGFAVVVFLFVALVLVVFRGGVPDDAVASVDGNAIPITQFNKTLKVNAAQSGGVVPDPPDYTKCIASKKKTSPKLSNSALKKQCEKDWTTSKDTIMTSLIQQKWFELEAEDRGINISDAEVKARFSQLKQQSFPKDADYQKFLKQYNQTEADLLKLVRASMIQEKVQQEVTTIPTPSTGQVKEEYEKNKKKYATPATRDINLVFNADKAKAEDAKAALESGDSWAAVAKKYSEDSVSKGNGGKFPGVTKGQFPKALDTAVFEAKKGEVVGPIKTQYGYYLFEVTKTTEASQQSLAKASPQIKSALQQEAQQKAQTNFQTEFTDKWRKKTKCAEDFKVDAVCGNAPEPKKGATAEAGAAAQ